MNQLANGALEPALQRTGKEAEAADFRLPGWQAEGRIQREKGRMEGKARGPISAEVETSITLSVLLGRTLQLVAGDLVVQALAWNTQGPGDPGLVPAAFGQGVEEDQPLALLDDLVKALTLRNTQQLSLIHI